MKDLRKLLFVLAVMATGALAAMPFQKGKRTDRPMQNALPEDLVLRRDVDWRIGLSPTSIRGPDKNGNTRRGPLQQPSRPAVIHAPQQVDTLSSIDATRAPELSDRYQPFGVSTEIPRSTENRSVGPVVRDVKENRYRGQPPPIPTDDPPALRHTIRDGDSLEELAARYLGDRELYLELFESNRDVLSRPDVLPIGREIRIPSRVDSTAQRIHARLPRILVP